MQTASDVAIEMKDLGNTDLERGGEPVPVKRSSCCGRVFKDWTQIPSTVCVSTSGALTVTFIIIAVAASLFMNDPNDATLRGGIIGGSSALAIFFLLNSAVQCVSCMRVRKFKPEKDLEDQIGTFRDRIGDLEGQNREIEDARKKLEQERAEWGNMLHQQDERAEKLQQRLDKKALQLDKVSRDLQGTQEALQQVSKAFEQFKAKTAEAYQFIAKLGEMNAGLGSQLKELGIQAEEFKELDKVWDGNIAGMSSETDEFIIQNRRLEALNLELQRQVKLMGSFHGMIAEIAAKVKDSAMRLDDYDDKLLKAADQLEKVEQEKSRRLGELETKLAEQKEILSTLKTVLLRQKNGEEKFKEVLAMINEILK